MSTILWLATKLAHLMSVRGGCRGIGFLRQRVLREATGYVGMEGARRKASTAGYDHRLLWHTLGRRRCLVGLKEVPRRSRCAAHF